jgi:hypothetical protein
MSVIYHLQDRTNLKVVNCSNVAHQLLRVVAKLRKDIISFVMSARPSVRMEHLGSTGEICTFMFGYFSKTCGENSSDIET